MRRDSVTGTIVVAAVLCVVCSVVVSTAAVVLKPRQDANAKLDMQKNVLAAAGLLDEGDDAAAIKAKFEKVKRQIIDLDTGEVASEEELKEAGITNIDEYDPAEAANNDELNQVVTGLPGIPTIAKYSVVYVAETEDGKLEAVVLPIYGKGLWSTMYGFLALDADLTTAKGITFYDQEETPGLGGEVDNPKWKNQWPGKKLRTKDGEVLIEVVKGQGSGDSEVDGLSGATITTNGVNDFVRFWLGEEGFGPYLENLASKENSDG